MNRIPTGISSLDDILQGGVPKGSTVLVVGRPGSGKTVLAHQIISFNAALNKKCIYFTTLSEPQVKILRFQQTFSYFDISKVGKSIIYRDMGEVLYKKGPAAALALVDEVLKEHQPDLIVVDSIKTLADIIPSFTDLRVYLLNLSVRLATWNCTSFLLGEYSELDIEIRPESSIADGIIYLSGLEEHKYQKRFLRILKMRGTEVPGGQCSFKISKDGIDVFPRLNPLVCNLNYQQFQERLSTGIPQLDSMMDGGIPRGSTTIVSGPSGSGKTILSMNFALAGVNRNENPLFITFEENPQQIISGALTQGIKLQPHILAGRLHIYYVSPMELDVDEHLHYIQNMVAQHKIKRLIIDSISSFELGISDKIKYTNYIWAMSNYFKVQGVTLMLTHEVFNPSGISELTKHGISYVADNLIQLVHKEFHRDIKHYLRVVKMRGSSHSTSLREFSITEMGFNLLED